MTIQDAASAGLRRRKMHGEAHADRGSDLVHRLVFGAIGWPWLLRSLHGGSAKAKTRLHQRLDLAPGTLAGLGSWRADAGFLHHIVDAIEAQRPATVVELGAGISTLVAARALMLHGGGRVHSYDHHAAFVESTARTLRQQGLAAELRHAPLESGAPGWPGRWYALRDVPTEIDLLIVDGPPWAIHPYVRGAAERLFDRLRPGGIVLLDDAARPGERIVAARWRRRWPEIAFRRVGGGSKGTLIGRKQDSRLNPAG